jgi:serine/threonine protein phosphatase 1
MPNRILAISDIHGNNKTFLDLLDKIALTKDDELYLLGDYIDRGPDSKGVIDTIWKLMDDNYRVFCIKGNHEEMLFRGIECDKSCYLFSKVILLFSIIF